MLFDVLLVIFALYIMAMPFCVLKFIQFGIKVGMEPEKAQEPIFNVPVVKRKKKPVLTPEQERTVKILNNIDAYNGDGIGQEKIE